MDWFKVVMAGLSAAPGLIGQLRGTTASNASKQQKARRYVDAVITTFADVDPTHAKQIIGHPAVRQAIVAANDWMYYAGKVADAIASGQEPPTPPAPPPPLLPVDTIEPEFPSDAKVTYAPPAPVQEADVEPPAAATKKGAKKK